MPHHQIIGTTLLVLTVLLILGIIRLRRRHRKNSGRDNPILQRACEHLQAVHGAAFQAKPLANRLEKTAYQTVLAILQKRRRNEHVLLQVSLGEILKSKDRRAYWAVNSKRVDLLVISRINDKIKDIALAAAGIPLIRIPAPDDNLGKIRALVHKQLIACLKRVA